MGKRLSLDLTELPPSWSTAKLGDLSLRITNGFVGTATPFYSSSESGVPYLQGNNVRENRLDLSGLTYVQVAFSRQQNKSILQSGDLLTVQSGHIGTTAVVPLELEGANCHALIITRLQKELAEPHFIAYYLNSVLTTRLRLLHVGSSVLHINTSELANFEVPLPPLPEQRAIAAILSTWDEAITLTTQLIDALKRRKQALMQLLLTGKVRFPGFEGEWEEVEIGDLLTESRIMGSTGADARKLTVKLYGKGVVPKAETKPGSENTTYYIRKAGQFIYSKLDFLNGAFGLIPEHLDGYETTLDLPSFDISSMIEASYLLNYISREEFYKAFLSDARGGRKAKRIQPSEFLNASIPLPAMEEQNKIADVVSLLKDYEESVNASFEAANRQKRGLMQQLLTGAVRVQVGEDGV